MAKEKLPPQLPSFTLEQLKIVVDNILSLNRPLYELGLIGGEPTVHPLITDIISTFYEALGKRLKNIYISTNGSRNKDFYKKIKDIASKTKINLCISIHTDHVEMAHILELIENLSGDLNLRFALMFNPDKREMVYEIYETLLKYRKKFSFHLNIDMLREKGMIDTRYTPEDFAWQKKAMEQFQELTKTSATSKLRSLALVDGSLNFKGMYCIAYSTVLRIDEEGRCRGMACDDDYFICNIFDKNCFQSVHDKLLHTIRCTKNFCSCPTNHTIPKFASEEEAKKFIAFAQRRQDELFAEYEQQSIPKIYLDSIENQFADLSASSFINSL